MKTKDIRSGMRAIEVNPARFPFHILQEAGNINPKLLEMRDFLVIKGSNVLCKLKTTPIGAREAQVYTGLSVVPVNP